VLINEQSSVFSIADFVERKSTFFRAESWLTRFAKRALPELGMNISSKRNYLRLGDLLLEGCSEPKVLVVGGGILGHGMEPLTSKASIKLIESDVALTPRTTVICDAHDLPFADQSFDGVIAQAVLEHVVDPYRCVAEFHRVLRERGLIYAETPFMQQVHGGRYDFTRFTYRGHRRLFRRFDEVESGLAGGPATALAWSYQYFLLSFARREATRAALKAIARITAFWLKYVDLLLINKASAFDAASGYYFMGRKSDATLADRDLVCRYFGRD
jgi:SAM-dependent methyltransferase